MEIMLPVLQSGCKVKVTSIIAYPSVKKTVPIIIETRTFEKRESQRLLGLQMCFLRRECEVLKPKSKRS